MSLPRHLTSKVSPVGSGVASVGTIRAALFDTFDANVRELSAHDCEYHPITDEEAFDNRFKFVDAVTERVGQLPRAPHDFDSTLNTYQSGYTDGWAAAHTATLQDQNADSKEMGRLVQVRRELR